MSSINVNTIKSRLGGPPTLPSGVVVSAAATFSSDVSIGGTLTYEDVTNVDVVGLITARSGIELGAAGVGGNARIVAGGSTTNVTASGTYNVSGLDIKISNYFSGNNGTAGGQTSAGVGAPTAYITGAAGDGSRTLFTGTVDVAQIFSTPDSSFYT